MATAFSIGFTGLFIAFAVAAVVGHALLAEALFRPFLGTLNLKPRPATSDALLANR